jgi:cytochrome c biogenesis protein ResB
MNILKTIPKIFLSVRTSIWLILALLGLLFYGAVLMPLKEEFLMLHATPLFQWLLEHPPAITWWLWGAIGVASLLAINTILCSIESLLKRRSARHWLLFISPQIIHTGFLFMLLAHLLSSFGGFKGTTFVFSGTMLQLPNGQEVVFDDITIDRDESGYISSWSAHIRYFKNGRHLTSDVILPNDPSFHEGLGIYIKTVQMRPFPSALIEVSREPGAIWALVGGVFFLVGMVTLLGLKIRKEEQ